MSSEERKSRSPIQFTSADSNVPNNRWPFQMYFKVWITYCLYFMYHIIYQLWISCLIYTFALYSLEIVFIMYKWNISNINFLLLLNYNCIHSHLALYPHIQYSCIQIRMATSSVYPVSRITYTPMKIVSIKNCTCILVSCGGVSWRE